MTMVGTSADCGASHLYSRLALPMLRKPVGVSLVSTGDGHEPLQGQRQAGGDQVRKRMNKRASRLRHACFGRGAGHRQQSGNQIVTIAIKCRDGRSASRLRRVSIIHRDSFLR